MTAGPWLNLAKIVLITIFRAMTGSLARNPGHDHQSASRRTPRSSEGSVGPLQIHLRDQSDSTRGDHPPRRSEAGLTAWLVSFACRWPAENAVPTIMIM